MTFWINFCMRNEIEGYLKFLKFKLSDHKKLLFGSPSKALFGHFNFFLERGQRHLNKA